MLNVVEIIDKRHKCTL